MKAVEERRELVRAMPLYYCFKGCEKLLTAVFSQEPKYRTRASTSA